MGLDRGIIYKITNKKNSLVYVGCTIYSLKKRFNEHLYRCFNTNNNSKLYNSIRKYGQENFTIELIEECDLNVIYEKEKNFIEFYDSYKNGLNSTIGGEGCLGYTHSQEVRKKISDVIKNGKSHKGKTYEEIYGDNATKQKENRSSSVKNKWNMMTEEEKTERVNKTRMAIQEKQSKYGVDLVKEIKGKINNGAKFKEIKEQYPNIKNWLYYALKNNQRWANI
jgi:group I intron endonuclease